MARLYADENVPLPVIEELRRLGHDVLTIFEDGKANQRYPDQSVLQDGAAHGRAVMTLNRKTVTAAIVEATTMDVTFILSHIYFFFRFPFLHSKLKIDRAAANREREMDKIFIHSISGFLDSASKSGNITAAMRIAIIAITSTVKIFALLRISLNPSSIERSNSGILFDWSRRALRKSSIS